MKGTLAFFVGGDITAHLIAQGVVRSLANEGFKILLVYPEQVIPGNKLRAGYEDFYRVERTLFHDKLFRLIDQSPSWSSNESLTPEGLRRAYPHQIRLLRIADVNSSAFLEVLEQEEVRIGISLRWYQKFGSEIIAHFSAVRDGGQGRLLNYHPGILPRYRGVITFIRALAAEDSVAGFTLHEIDARWDAGPILCYSVFPLEQSLSVLGNMCAHVPSATTVLIDALKTLAAGLSIPPVPQDEKTSGYFTFPTLEELFALQLRGIHLVSRSDAQTIMSEHFGATLSELRGGESEATDIINV